MQEQNEPRNHVKKISYEDEMEPRHGRLSGMDHVLTISRLFNLGSSRSCHYESSGKSLSKINFWVRAYSLANSVYEEQEMRKKRNRSDVYQSMSSIKTDYSNFGDSREFDDSNVVVHRLPLSYLLELLSYSELWGTFYVTPELYEDRANPTVRLIRPDCLQSAEDGILRREQIAANLSYLARTPITGQFVFIKLNLFSNKLQEIARLKYYRFIQHLDLSKNFLTDLNVLSCLPYLQYLSVNFNSLTTVLDYDEAQWYLTEVHYKYNDVKKIQDLTRFWSLTILDLSNNNIKYICGLDNLKYLRRLDLSFNHIKRLENLNHLRLTWLDLSYNNISSFECGPDQGLKTLLHLEFLNLNENILSTLRVIFGCNRLRHLHLRNNHLYNMLEVAVYMRQMHSLHVLDLRGNLFCSSPFYRPVILRTVFNVMMLDDKPVDMVEMVTVMNDSNPDIFAYASQRLMRLLYIEQLTKANILRFTPPADTRDVPIVILVGQEASGKGTLCRRLASEWRKKVRHARLHTTNKDHCEHYIHVDIRKMDTMIATGELLTYGEISGYSYGLSREEAFTRDDGRVTVAHMDQTQALMMRLRHRRPYLVLVHYTDTKLKEEREEERKKFINDSRPEHERIPTKKTRSTTLQGMISKYIEIGGLLNEIIMNIPSSDETPINIHLSNYSLTLSDHEFTKVSSHGLEKNEVDHIISKSSLSLQSIYKDKEKKIDPHEQKKRSIVEMGSEQKKTSFSSKSKFGSHRQSRYSDNILSRLKSVDTTKMESTHSSKAMATYQDSTKSVTFQSQDEEKLTGLLVDDNFTRSTSGIMTVRSDGMMAKSISTKFYHWLEEKNMMSMQSVNTIFHRDPGMWDTFVDEIAKKFTTSYLPQAKDLFNISMKLEETLSLTVFSDLGNKVEHDYVNVHREHPGLYWDTICMDDPDKGYNKLKNIVKSIVSLQDTLHPMFDIDFKKYDTPLLNHRRTNIMKDISTNKMFY